MIKKTGLGINVTPDLVNDFFSIKPKSVNEQTKFIKHHIGTTDYSTRATSGFQTPFNDTYGFEQNWKLANLDYENDQHDKDYDRIKNESKKFEDVEEGSDDEAERERLSETLRNNPEFSIEVYDNYSFEHVYDDNLPITQVRDEVIQNIEANKVTIIQGSTGSGKTTQVPQYILDHYYEKRKYCNILVTQPRRIAAMSIAKRVSEERHWPLGKVVGYQVGQDRNVTEDTRITYMTTGVLLQKLIKNKNLDEYTHVILDEVHERDQDIDFAMLVVRKYIRSVSKYVKVVLMSATVDSSLFSKYFSYSIRGKKEPAPVISVEGIMYPVTEYYFENFQSAQLPQLDFYEPEISMKTYLLCRELILHLDMDELGDDYKPGKVAERRGTALCFLPGLQEIKEMHKYLADIEVSMKLKVLPLHSQITSAEQNRVFFAAAKGERKVILSTNIAESSITVPDIKYVFDFCLTKNLETDCETNYQRLVLQWASQASLTQRKGRAGRVSEGHCFRLITKRLYDRLPDYHEAEMLRSPLEQVILKVKLLELGPPAPILHLALEPPDLSNIKRTILMLKEVGALTVRQDGKINPIDGDLTFVGRVLGSLPVDVHIGKLLLMGYTFGVLEECLVLGACLSLKSMFMRPFREDIKAYSNKMHWSRGSSSDLLAAYYAFLAWKIKKEKTGFGEPEKSWARKNLLEYRRFAEIDALQSELRSRLASTFNITTHRMIFDRQGLSKEDELVLKLVIAGAFFPSYFETKDIDEEEASRELSGHNPFTTVYVQGAPPTLCHYRSKVATLFRNCGQGKRMYFENSRAFVEFENNTIGESPVAPAVYKAIKMRQLRLPLSFFVSKETDDKFRSSLSEEPLESFNPETGLKSNRLNAGFGVDGRLSMTVEGNLRQVKLKESGYINCYVQEIVTAGHFWATYADKETTELMQQMHLKINSLSGRNLQLLDPSSRNTGSYCLAQFEGEYFRAEITKSTINFVQVHFVDYGNTATITDWACLRKCPESLMKIPFQAFECFLSEIRPVLGSWTDEAHHYFSQAVTIGQKQLVGKIYSQVYGKYRLELFDGDMNINKELIRHGYAMYAEEPTDSKVKHDQALNAASSNSQQKSRHPATDKVIEDVSRTPKGNEEVIKITLRGPHSPYEFSFYGVTASSGLRGARVEQDSVNSVVICEEPQEKHPRLLVAAHINVNQSGNSIIARETTLLPNIHGLNYLMPLLFAPVAELRTTRKMTKYIGALCGLGYDHHGAAILPDHDIEVTFDTTFDKQDLTEINSLRLLMNTVIGIEEEKIDFAPNKTKELQKLARNKLLKLINKQREDVEPQHSRCDYRWNQVPDDYILEPGHKELPIHLYVYHRGILLTEEQPKVDPWYEQTRAQIKEFHEMAGRSTIPFAKEIICPVCNVRCTHPRSLYLHIETPSHISWIKTLCKDP